MIGGDAPKRLAHKIDGCRQHSRGGTDCLFCRVVENEMAARTRVVYDGAHFVALAPFASRFPFETWVLPKRHAEHFDRQPVETYGDLANVMCAVLSRLDAVLDCPAYNYLIHTAPFGRSVCYHWHIEIIPSVTRMAGFEWGTGFYINPVSPESAAALMARPADARPGR